MFSAVALAKIDLQHTWLFLVDPHSSCHLFAPLFHESLLDIFVFCVLGRVFNRVILHRSNWTDVLEKINFSIRKRRESAISSISGIAIYFLLLNRMSSLMLIRAWNKYPFVICVRVHSFSTDRLCNIAAASPCFLFCFLRPSIPPNFVHSLCSLPCSWISRFSDRVIQFHSLWTLPKHIPAVLEFLENRPYPSVIQ